MPDDFDILPMAPDWGDEEEQRQIAQYVEDRLRASADFDDAFKQSNLIDLQNYASRTGSFNMPGWQYGFHLFDPETQNAANTAQETTMSSTFAKERFFDLRGTSGQDEVQVEIKREHMLHAARRARWKMRYYNWAQDATLWGNGVMATWACPYWVRDRGAQRSMQSDPYGYGVRLAQSPGMMGLGGTPHRGVAAPDEQKPGFHREIWPEFRNISRWDLYPYPGPGFSDVQDMPFFGFDLFLPLATVKRMATRPWAMWNAENVEKLRGEWGVDRNSRTVSGSDKSWDNIWDRLAYMGYTIVKSESQNTHAVRYCRVSFYYEAPPGGRGCRAYAVVCEQKLLACRGNEYEHAMKPIADLKWIPFLATDVWQCWGVPSLIRPYQDRLNITLGQKYELREKFLFPTRIVRPGQDPSLLNRLLDAMAGDVIEADKDAVSVLEQPSPRADFFDDEDRSQMGLQRAVRQTDINMGNAPTQGGDALKTASGLRYLGNAGQLSAVFRTLFFEEGGVVPQLEQLASVLEQTLPDEGHTIPLTDTNETLARAGHKGNLLHVTPESVAGDYEIVPVGASKVADAGAEVSDIIGLLKEAAGMREVADKIDWMGEYKHLYERLTKRQPILLSPAEAEQKAQQPKPLPKEMLPKSETIAKHDKGAFAQVLQRSGLQPTEGSTTEREKEQAETQRTVMKTAARKRFVPRSEQPVEAGV
jgi:hypothetical protein